MHFDSAGQAEILRSSQKDQFYISQLRSKLADVFQSWAGARAWIKWRAELDLVTDCLYFGLTTLSGLQTLGEEYVNILQVDHTRRAVPSLQRRTFLVFTHVVFPYLLDKFLSRLSYRLGANLSVPVLPLDWRERLKTTLPLIRHLLLLAHRTHMAFFYLSGVFYHIAKRSSAVQYLMVRRGLSRGSLNPSFRLLGIISLIQLALSVSWQLYQWKKVNGENEERPVSESFGRVSRCFVTMFTLFEQEKRYDCYPCGHLFCCIALWNGVLQNRNVLCAVNLFSRPD
ncbi:hypothetical protein BSL78_18014 [Apostichopus japonicus]|uniref:RING-type E3 ubiquitin transferase n=1 Tax=Stichopus japonicus TaxID=307972 RepID=A0A2G8KAW8_STIJA|nr:hypothetical protein BSL78_18014 [Apostichopus japonicus]